MQVIEPPTVREGLDTEPTETVRGEAHDKLCAIRRKHGAARCIEYEQSLVLKNFDRLGEDYVRDEAGRAVHATQDIVLNTVHIDQRDGAQVSTIGREGSGGCASGERAGVGAEGTGDGADAASVA